jgi:hypothetical protein
LSLLPVYGHCAADDWGIAGWALVVMELV